MKTILQFAQQVEAEIKVAREFAGSETLEELETLMADLYVKNQRRILAAKQEMLYEQTCDADAGYKASLEYFFSLGFGYTEIVDTAEFYEKAVVEAKKNR